jgi:hypothetical protein
MMVLSGERGSTIDWKRWVFVMKSSSLRKDQTLETVPTNRTSLSAQRIEFNTLFEGALGTTWGGILRIKAGSGTGEGNAPISIGKPITLTAVGGPVTIGR